MSTILLLFALISCAACARILGITPIPSYSHQVAYQSLWKELSLRGHQVTLLTPLPMKNPGLVNLTEIDMNDAYDYWHRMSLSKMTAATTVSGFMRDAVLLITDTAEFELQLPAVTALLKNDSEHFDLLMVEGWAPVMFYFSERFRCPYIKLFSLEPPARNYRMMGNPTNPAVYPDFALPQPDFPFTFLERLHSVAHEIYMDFMYRTVLNPTTERAVVKHFGDGYPSVEEVVAKASMMFINTNPITMNSVRATVPGIVEFGGGTHLKPLKPLPKDLKKVLDSAHLNGVIYFSLGSNMKTKDLTPEKRRMFIEVISELPQTVLWKLDELDEMPDKPSNVIISSWFPQQDVLNHPNVKLFITQGGLHSMEEAIYAHVPMLGIPCFGDQPRNVRRMANKGFGLMLDFETLDKATFKAAILEVLDNPRYKEKVRELAEISLDQPLTGLERAVWWTEYVIRHKGAGHLRSPTLAVPWYQYFLLDIIFFCFLTILLIAFFVSSTIKLLLKLSSHRSQNKIKVN